MANYRRSRNGRTIKEAAELTGLSTRSIVRWTSEPREVFLARANDRRRQVKMLRDQDYSMRDIARMLDISVGTVHRYVHEDPRELPAN